MSGGWQGSNRRSTLPPNWAELVAAVHRRSGYKCEVPRASRGGEICGRPADGGVDHFIDPQDHRLEALRDTCHWHHSRKSSAEGNAAQANLKALRTNPPEDHPGRLR